MKKLVSRYLLSRNAMKIVILRSGLLGDTLVSLPTLWLLKETYPNSEIIYIGEQIKGKPFVFSDEVLAESGLVDSFERFITHADIVSKVFSYLKLLIKLRIMKVDIGIVLEASHWSSKRNLFLKLCGAKKILKHKQLRQRFLRNADGTLVEVDCIADDLVKVLKPLGIATEKQHGNMVLPITASENERVEVWCKSQKSLDPSRPWVMVAAWSNMASKRWPKERYTQVIRKLIEKFNVIPVIFGSKEEKNVAEDIISSVGRGVCAAGELSIKESTSLASMCTFYLGNDTGSMHMAVAAGIPCVAIFASIDEPGLWYPYGKKHTVLRTDVECEGCMLRECTVENMKCIKAITVTTVLEACCKYL